ncbi:MAG: magnesium/cobalt transporter CorA [Actinobacteria bacterium]|nr:magnesium/cobalt transporter CorA [Actinomycetota bacterium]
MRFLDRIDKDAIGALLDRDEYFWLDLDRPGEEEVDILGELFHFHPLALEDLRKKGQRPKLEDFGDYMFLVYYAAGDPDDGAAIHLEEVHAFIGGGYLVTAHDGVCGALDEARKRLEALPPSSEQFVVYRVLDTLTDTFFPLLEALEERLEQLDEEIFNAPSPDHLQPLTELRSDLVQVGRVATPQRDMLARHIDDILQIPGLEADSRNYFRDVYDHAIRISDQIDAYRDLLIGSRDAYLSVTSNRLNEITKQLTVIATIFLPLSFVVGFFGQNFKWMVERMTTLTEFLVLGGGTMVVSLVILLVWLRRSSYA